MSEPTYGELFDFYCVKILAELYECRGKSRKFAPDQLLEERPKGASVETSREAAYYAGIWLTEYGYAKGAIAMNPLAAHLSITLRGILVSGQPEPGKRKVSWGLKSLEIAGNVTRDGFTAATSAALSAAAQRIASPAALQWATSFLGFGGSSVP